MIRKFYSLILRLKRRYYSEKFKILTKNKNNVYCIGNINTINTNIKVGNNVQLYPNVSFEGEGLIEIGNNVKIGTNTIIYSHPDGGIKIGDNTIIAGNCYIIDSNHKVYVDCIIQEQGFESKKVNIGEDVWIGANCTIVKGTNLLDGVVIGANSLVNSEISKNYIAFGNPARIYKKRKKK